MFIDVRNNSFLFQIDFKRLYEFSQSTQPFKNEKLVYWRNLIDIMRARPEFLSVVVSMYAESVKDENAGRTSADVLQFTFKSQAEAAEFSNVMANAAGKQQLFMFDRPNTFIYGTRPIGSQ